MATDGIVLLPRTAGGRHIVSQERRARLLRRLARAVMLTLGAAVFAVVAAVTAPGLVGMHTIVVTGGSMGSALPLGSVAVTRTIDMHDVRAGDVIAFRQPGAGATVIHRVVDIQNADEGLVATTKGDANAAADPEPLLMTSRGDRVVYHVPYVGYAVVYARTPVGLLVMLIVFCVLLIRNAPLGVRRHAAAPAVS